MEYEQAVRTAWEQLIRWTQEGKLVPENEEEIQCFLYHGIIGELGLAKHVKPKLTMDKPEKLAWKNGSLDVGNMHFPDFVIGANHEVVAEIKFARMNDPGSVMGGCKRDIKRMMDNYPRSTRIFVLFDQNPGRIFLSETQLTSLKSIDSACEILYFPKTLSAPKPAEKAIEVLKKKGYDFRSQGIANARKAMKLTSK